MDIAPSPPSPSSPARLFWENQHAETPRTSNSGGSPPRAIQAGQAGGDEKERSMNSDEALDAVEEEALGVRRDRKTFTAIRCHINQACIQTSEGRDVWCGVCLVTAD